MRSLSSCVLSVSLVTTLAAGGCKNKVDTKGFEDTIRQRTSELGLHATKVTCPSDVEAKQGNVFTCQVELDGKKTYGLDVTLKSVDKASKQVNLDTAWHDGAAVVVAKLEPGLTEELSKQFSNPVTLKCGDEPLRFLDAQHKVKCQLTTGEVKSTATIDFDEELKPTAWHLDPAILARAKLEEILTPSVREKTSPDVKVDCGPSAILSRPADGVVWCSIADGEKQAKIKVEIDDGLNVKRWEVANPPG